MMSFEPFWSTLEASEESTYSLIHYYHISSATIHKLRKNSPVNTTTLNDLCMILHCNVQDLMVYVPSDKDQPLWDKISKKTQKKHETDMDTNQQHL